MAKDTNIVLATEISSSVFPCRAIHVIYRFDGKLEPGFFQHILVGSIEQQAFHYGIGELEPFQHQAYMFT